MEKLLKMTIALIMGLGLFGFQSCGNDDEPESKLYASATEIQGEWHGSLNGYYYTFAFNGSEYNYSQMDMSSSEIVNRSYGTFEIRNGNIIFTATSGVDVPWSNYEIYWSNSLKNRLNIGDLLSLLEGK